MCDPVRVNRVVHAFDVKVGAGRVAADVGGELQAQVLPCLDVVVVALAGDDVLFAALQCVFQDGSVHLRKGFSLSLFCFIARETVGELDELIDMTEERERRGEREGRRGEERERERERERETETETETEREAGRQTETETERQKQRDKNRETETEAERQTDRQIERTLKQCR